MMKQFLVYLFCISITLQSVIGQFMFYNHSANTLYTSISSFSFDKRHVDAPFSHGQGLAKQGGDSIRKAYKDKLETNAELPKFVRDSVVEHLFSPSNCPNEAGHAFVFSFLFLGNCFDLFVIEEKISNFVHFYSTFFRNIQIGLPITKLIYPYHNFY